MRSAFETWGRRAALGALLLLGGMAPAVFAADNTLTAEEAAAGWRLLFDGRTFAGWVDPATLSPPGDSFSIEDGCLKAKAHPRITEDLFTELAFGDFELEFDWKIAPGGNSGVKYRIQDHVFVVEQRGLKFEDLVNASLKNRPAQRPSTGQDYVIGFEYQLLDNQRNSDARAGLSHQAGALYDMVPPSADVTRPVGEFNHARLVVMGSHVEHWLNGVKVVDASLDAPAVAEAAARRWGAGSPVAELLAKQPRKSCPISLQNHGDEAWFKNLKIREPGR